MRKEIDVLKALAIIAVICLHYNAFKLTSQTLLWDQFLRFCVPLFVALSGYALTKKYLTIPLSIKDFYLRRVTKLLPLYIFWSLIIYFALNFNLNNIIKMLIYGQADYHLYYVPMIFQLYLIFPLIFYFLKNHANIVLFAALVLQLLTFYYYSQNPQFSDQEQYIHMTTWIYYFTLGIYLAATNLKPTKIVFLLIPVGFALSLWDTHNLISQHFDLIVATKTFRPAVMIYATGIILTVIFYSKKILLLPSPILKILVFIGVQSYLIYLCHTLFLRLIFARIAPQISQGNIDVIFLFAVGGVLLCQLPWVFKKFKIFEFFGEKR